MLRYKLITGNVQLADHMAQHPPRGPEWEGVAEADDGRGIASDSEVVIITPEDTELDRLPISPAIQMGIKAKVQWDMQRRRRPAATANAPVAAPAPTNGLRQYSATTTDDAIAGAFKSIQQSDRWQMSTTHLSGAESSDYLQIMDDTGRVIPGGNVPLSPRGSLMSRIKAAVDEHFDGRRPAPVSVKPEPPAPITLAEPATPEAPPPDIIVRHIPIGDILTGDNNRTDMGDLDDFAADVKRRGIKQPLTVREENGKFRLTAGERRLRAARLAGLKWVPCIVDDDDEGRALEWMITENGHRKDLSPIEEARGYQRMLARPKTNTHEKVAAAVSRNRVRVTEYLALLDLPDDLQHQVATGVMAVRTALEYLRRTKDAPEQAKQQVAAAMTAEAPSARGAASVIDRELERAGVNVARTTKPDTRAAQSPPADPTKTGAEAPAPERQPEKPPEQPAPPPTVTPINPGGQRARQLAEIGGPIWQHRIGEQASGATIYQRECYLDVLTLVDHWRDRAAIGATIMPTGTGRSVLDIPEQRVWISGTGELAHMAYVSVEDNDLAVTVPCGGVRCPNSGQPVYYRVEIIRPEGATDSVALLQQVVIRDGSRHILISGHGSAMITGERVARLTELIDQLPGMPAA